MAADAQLVIWAYESFSGVGMDVGDWFALFRCALLIVAVIQYVPVVGNLANGQLVCAGEVIAGTGAYLPVAYFSRVESPVENDRAYRQRS